MMDVEISRETLCHCQEHFVQEAQCDECTSAEVMHAHAMGEREGLARGLEVAYRWMRNNMMDPELAKLWRAFLEKEDMPWYTIHNGVQSDTCNLFSRCVECGDLSDGNEYCQECEP